MSDGIAGGAYLAPDGKTLVDSEGRPLSKEAQAEARKLAAEREAAAAQMIEAELAQAAMQQSALARALLGNSQPAAPARKSAKE